MNQSDSVFQGIEEKLHNLILVRMQMYHNDKTIPNRNFLVIFYQQKDIKIAVMKDS